MNFEVLDDFNGLEMGFISNNSGGYISKNKYLFEIIFRKDIFILPLLVQLPFVYCHLYK